MTRGGKREGAGRKALPPEKKRKPHTVWLSEDEAAYIRECADGNLSEGVRALLVEYSSHDFEEAREQHIPRYGG